MKMCLKGIYFMQVFLLLLIAQTKGYFLKEEKATLSPSSPSSSSSLSHVTTQEQKQQRLDFGDSLKKEETLRANQFEERENDNENGLIEVKESEIPEGAMVYVLEEPEDTRVDGETLKTASNIVFRPLFRYRSKQEAQRRNSRIRRRYFMPRRSYRHAYNYPYFYYPQRYYY